MTGDEIEKRLKNSYLRPSLSGYEFTFHAVRRAIERKIHTNWMLEALNSSNWPGSQPGTRKFLGPLAMVTINPATKEIITVGYGRLNKPN